MRGFKKTDYTMSNLKTLLCHKNVAVSVSYNVIALSRCLNSVMCITRRHYASRNTKERLKGSYTMYVKDKKMGEKLNYQEDVSRKDIIMEGLKILNEGIPEFKKEIKEKFMGDVNIFPDHLDFEYLFQADDKESMSEWLVSTDADYDGGKSTAKFSVSRSNKALFHGVMNTELPNDGKTVKTGFCNLRSPCKYKSFKRQIPFDWSMYTHLLLRVRGDGRNYMINLHPDRYFDVHWMDLYQYPLYTRGGPYWQFVKIPFANFFLSAVGRLQDQQEKVELDCIKYLSINAMDYGGPFELEIDYIALIYDANDDNPHLYEHYEKSPFDFE